MTNFNSNNNDRHLVAIESTNDIDGVANFHKKLIDIDVENTDGSYGKVVDFYRIVDLNENGRVKPMDDRVFTSEKDALEAIAKMPNVEKISYDDMVTMSAKKIRVLEIAKEGIQNTKDAIKTNDNDKHLVTIESTEDYVTPNFYAKLVDADVRNNDGSYGRIQDQYRIADIGGAGKDAHMKAYDDRIFNSRQEARNAILANPSLKEIGYDAMVNLVWDIKSGLAWTRDSQQKKQEQNIEKRERRPARNQDKGMDK